jgi:hypothetical protein
MTGRIKWLAMAALLGIALGLGTAQAQDIDAAERTLVERYAAAVTAHDVEALKALYHPASIACIDAANQDYFDFLFDNDLRFQNDLKSGYKVTAVGPADPYLASMNSMDGMLVAPVTPTHQFQIDTTGGDGSRAVTIVRMTAERDGVWFIVAGCPTEKGLAAFRQRRGAAAPAQARIQELASKLGEPLLSELKDLLTQNRRIDAIKRYEDAAKVDLTTAVQVIDALGKPSQ